MFFIKGIYGHYLKSFNGSFLSHSDGNGIFMGSPKTAINLTLNPYKDSASKENFYTIGFGNMKLYGNQDIMVLEGHDDLTKLPVDEKTKRLQESLFDKVQIKEVEPNFIQIVAVMKYGNFCYTAEGNIIKLKQCKKLDSQFFSFENNSSDKPLNKNTTSEKSNLLEITKGSSLVGNVFSKINLFGKKMFLGKNKSNLLETTGKISKMSCLTSSSCFPTRPSPCMSYNDYSIDQMLATSCYLDLLRSQQATCNTNGYNSR